MAAEPQAALSAALDRMWVQYLPLMQERVEVLEAAAREFAAGPLSVDRQQEAQAAASAWTSLWANEGQRSTPWLRS